MKKLYRGESETGNLGMLGTRDYFPPSEQHIRVLILSEIPLNLYNQPIREYFRLSYLIFP